MILLTIGAIIGLVMGLTGAGGALISIPLFIHFQGMSLKEASIFSLMAVVIASTSNFIYQREEARINLALIMILSSSIGSLLSQPYKSYLSDIFIGIILSLISIYSLYSVWFHKGKLRGLMKSTPSIWITILIGLLLGLLTTFTGLGGGVLILPILLSIYRLESKEAVATSLLIVGLSSLASFIIQIKDISQPFESKYLLLIIGIIIVSYLLKKTMIKLSSQCQDNLRKVVFSIVVVISLTKIFMS